VLKIIIAVVLGLAVAMIVARLANNRRPPPDK
jgi:uncharacterized membrane-anchored protein YhcB (DUF1043 family)